MDSIGAKMRERRIELGISQQELADAIGVYRGTIVRWENGTIQNMGRDKIVEIAKALQMRTEDLIGTSMTPQQKVLFDSAADLTPEETNAVLAMITALKAQRGSD